jgi:hypothetical protein
MLQAYSVANWNASLKRTGKSGKNMYANLYSDGFSSLKILDFFSWVL